MMRIQVTIFILMIGSGNGYAQQLYNWWNPEKSTFRVVEGQGWTPQAGEYFYGRIPERAKPELREVLWTKSQQTTGLLIRFVSDAPSISVRYQTEGVREFEHMPATGVSGVDLYALNKSKQWEWPGFTYLFKDTIQYFFDSLRTDGHKNFYLYLPLYAKLKWLEVGVPPGYQFKPLPARKEKPIVVYGTSIVQGGCASRPGMAWTSILSRKLQWPVINLGFSGNGLLETPVIDLISGIDAEIYILDCLPNLISYPSEEIARRIKEAVKQLRNQHASTPILLTEHGDANINLLDKHLHQQFTRVNKVAKETYQELVKSGVKNLYYLSADKIGMDINSTVDGSHPSDFGMYLYATAYFKKIREMSGKK